MITDIESATPALCRLQLGSELRQLRLAAGYNGRTVVRKLLVEPVEAHPSGDGRECVGRAVRCHSPVEIYGATPEKRAMLQEYAAVTKTRRDWWQSAEYTSRIRPGFKAFLGLEATASTLQNYESEFVPGLLQTEAYVRVTMSALIKG